VISRQLRTNLEIPEHGFSGQHAHIANSQVILKNNEGSKRYDCFSNPGLLSFTVAPVFSSLLEKRMCPVITP